MLNRRKVLQIGSLGISSIFVSKTFGKNFLQGKKPLVLSTWDVGVNANKAAWNVLRSGGRALDAVEQGVMVTEAENQCCVGLAAYPDRDGFVTLDASIMDEYGNAGSVAFLERIKHPISVARKVMEKTPHVMLVGSGAQQFALKEGFPLEEQKLSDDSKKAYDDWLKKSEYKPEIDIENKKGQNAFAPAGRFNHDTIGMIAIDAKGDLSGSCTTSGLAFKMHGRVGDSPIIGAGLYVDNEIGAAVATGVGEEVIKICGTHLIVQLMAQGLSPMDACKRAVQKIIKRNSAEKIKNIQVGFLALNKQGEYGAYSIQKEFNYALCYSDDKNDLIDAGHEL